MALSKPYTVTAGQTADIDLMLDELYQAVQDLDVRVTASAAVASGLPGPRGFPGMRGGEGERGTRGVPGSASTTSSALANPSATIGLAAINGSAVTGLRSDGAPALSQAIAPTWSAAHTFSERIAASKGISFPATQVASAGANDLDDYEEGTWTPLIGGSGGQSGQIYLTQAGFYVKIGKLVWVTGYVQLSTGGTITDFMELQGLPFTSENTANQFVVGTVQWSDFQTGQTWVNLNGRIGANATVVLLMGARVAATANTTRPANADLSGSIFFIFTQLYKASA